MSVMRALTFRPAPAPMATMVFARSTESSSRFRNAPLPVFTSSTMPSLPAASFLLMIDEAMRGMLSTVAVTSRRA